MSISESGFFHIGRPVSPQNNTIRVLQVEDNPDDAALLHGMLSSRSDGHFEIKCVERLAAAFEATDRDSFDVILLDLSLPDGHGLDTFLRMRAHARDIPIIVLSGYGDEETAVATVKSGAQDYLVKSEMNPRMITRCLLYAIERHRIEQELSFERYLLHALLDSVPDRIYFKDHDSRFLRVSNSVAQFHNLKDSSELEGKSDFDFFAQEHAQSAFDGEKEIIENGEPLIGKVEKITLLDGRVSWVLTNKMPLRHKDGPIVGTFGVTKDITQIMEIQAALDEERNLLRRLIDSVPDHIYVKDLNNHFTLVNSAAANFLGLASPDEIAGKKDSDFMSPELAAQFQAEDNAVLAGATHVNREAPVTSTEGASRWVLTTKVPLKDRQGATVGLVGINRDITERKAANDELHRVHTELKKTHAELVTAQLQLIQSEKLQLTGRLAAGVAHDVKNPLAVAVLCADFLSMSIESSDPDIAATLKNLKEAVQRADSVIRGLLDFSVPNSLALQSEDLNKILKQSLQYVNHEATKRHISVKNILKSDLPRMSLDSNKMKQVFVNLMSNAIHAMPDKGCLTVTTTLQSMSEMAGTFKLETAKSFKPNDSLVVIKIEDNGSGIPEKFLKDVFEPFFTTKPTGQGTGLGLVVSKQIVEMHGGLIDIRNGLSGGACATVIFPLEERRSRSSVRTYPDERRRNSNSSRVRTSPRQDGGF